ncbi:hypothetical protein DFH09DRAFT_1085966 [Mycena vulgaris]|nr:hypothetical protein DFH09DRAFT_1085966 [Mycena vulgaris]
MSVVSDSEGLNWKVSHWSRKLEHPWSFNLSSAHENKTKTNAALTVEVHDVYGVRSRVSSVYQYQRLHAPKFTAIPTFLVAIQAPWWRSFNLNPPGIPWNPIYKSRGLVKPPLLSPSTIWVPIGSLTARAGIIPIAVIKALEKRTNTRTYSAQFTVKSAPRLKTSISMHPAESMSAASPTASSASRENDTAEQLQKLKRRGDNYQREVYNGRKKLKRLHAAATDQFSSLARSRVENGQLRAESGQLMAEVAGLRAESSSLRVLQIGAQ